MLIFNILLGFNLMLIIRLVTTFLDVKYIRLATISTSEIFGS